MASKLYHGRVAGTSGVLVTSDKTQQIVACSVSNTTATARTLKLWVTASGGAVGDTNVVLEPKTIDANTTVGIPEIVAMTIANGEEIHGLAEAADALTIRISGS